MTRRAHRARAAAVVAVLITTTTATVPAAAAATPPSVTAVAPSIGLVAGGTRVTVTGSGFSGVRSVVFGKAAGAAVHVLSTTRLQVTSPPHYESTVHVQVITAAGKSRAVHVDEYTYRYAPAATGTPSVFDTTATSIALSWRASVDPRAVVEVHRASGATAPTSPSPADLVATLPAGATQYRDTGLTKNRQYAYALFTKADGLYSRTGPSTSATTTSTPRPAQPALQDTNPSVLPGCLDGTSYVGLERQMTIASAVEAPDSQTSFVRTRMRLVDYGDEAGAAPVELIGYGNEIGESGRVLVPGTAVNSIYLDNREDGHEYGFSLIALDDSNRRSTATPECRFLLDRQAPSGPNISGEFPPDGVARVGHPATITMTATEPTSPSGRASGIDHFLYSIGSCSGLGTELAPTSADGMTAIASFTFTPTLWGTTYICAAAVDGAGNHSGNASYDFYVVDSRQRKVMAGIRSS